VTHLPGEVRIAPDPEGLADAVSGALRDLSAASGSRFAIALAGGRTPRAMYVRLASEPLVSQIDWSRWHVYFSDERAAPPGDEASNYHLAESTMLDTVPIPCGQVYRMHGEAPDLDAAAAEYSSLLATTLGTPPRFDCVLLGLGTNGHTASLFPNTAALGVANAYATRGLADYQPYDRLTLTFPAINAARCVIFTVTGADKGDALRAVVAGTAPAAGVKPSDGRLIWYLDEAAASSMG